MPMVADTVRSLSAALVAAGLMIAAIVLGREILVPLALATIIAFILAPAVHRLSRMGIPRGLSAVLCVALVSGLVTAGSVTFSSQLLSLAAEMSDHKDNIVRKVRTVAGFARSDGVIAKATNSIETLGKDVRRALDQDASQVAGEASPKPDTAAKESGAQASEASFDLHGISQRLLAPLTTGGLTLLFTVFLLAQYEGLRDRIVRLAGTENITITAAALTDVGERLSSMFTLQATLNFGFGAFVAVALTLIGVPNALMWGAATALLRFVPFIGSILAAVPPILLVAAVDPGWGKTVATMIVFLVGEVTVGHFIEPLVLGRRAGLSPLAFLLAASFWTLVWGPIGLILAAPITMCLVVLGLYIPSFEFLSVLLGDAPPLTPAQEFYHRLLSGQPLAAYRQIAAADENDSVTKTTDAVVLPALQQAAKDHRSGKIASDQIKTIRESLDEVVELLDAETPRDERGMRSPQHPMLMIAGRGPIDLMAASYLANSIRRDTGMQPIMVESATGLMALQNARQAIGDKQPGGIVVVSVGGLDQTFARLLEKRTAAEFPGARIIACNLNALASEAPGGREQHRREDDWAGNCTSFRALRDIAHSAAERGDTSGSNVPGSNQSVSGGVACHAA